MRSEVAHKYTGAYLEAFVFFHGGLLSWYYLVYKIEKVGQSILALFFLVLAASNTEGLSWQSPRCKNRLSSNGQRSGEIFGQIQGSDPIGLFLCLKGLRGRVLVIISLFLLKVSPN